LARQRFGRCHASDCHAAKRAGIATVAVLTVGSARSELLEAGASHALPSLSELLAQLGDAPLS
jgi:phosphoglycolate phosphatase-like HAD superfamily hydrolase